MKATGIVRRMDDLGRVVIPKEIRRTMKIGEGTPLEIFIDKDGGIIFRKYSPVGEMSESAQRMSECVSAMCGAGVAVSDRDRIVAAAGIPKKELVDKPVSKQLEELMRKKKPFISSGEDTVLAADGGLRTADAAFLVKRRAQKYRPVCARPPIILPENEYHSFRCKYYLRTQKAFAGAFHKAERSVRNS